MVLQDIRGPVHIVQSQLHSWHNPLADGCFVVAGSGGEEACDEDVVLVVSVPVRVDLPPEVAAVVHLAGCDHHQAQEEP